MNFTLITIQIMIELIILIKNKDSPFKKEKYVFPKTNHILYFSSIGGTHNINSCDNIESQITDSLGKKKFYIKKINEFSFFVICDNDKIAQNVEFLKIEGYLIRKIHNHKYMR